MSFRQVFNLLILAIFGLSMSACLSIDDFVKVKVDPEPPIDKPIHPNPPDIPGGGNSGGSDGIDPGDPLPGDVTERAVLKLNAIHPTSGDVAGGYALSLRGTGFRESDKVRLGALEIGQKFYVNDRSMRIVVPSAKPGCVDVVIESAEGSERLEKAFCYTERLGLEQVEPKRVLTDAAVPLTLKGSGFNAATQVYFQQNGLSLPLIAPKLRSSSQITGYLPSFAAGFVDLSVTNETAKYYLNDAIEVIEAMAIEDVEPRAIALGTQPELKIYGKGLDVKGLSLRLASEILSPSEQSAELLKFKAPLLEEGSYDIVLLGDSQQVRYEAALHYYLDDGQSKIFAIDPVQGPLEGGEACIIAVNYPKAFDVYLGENLAEILSLTPSLTVAVPSVSTPQVVDLSLDGEARQSQLDNAYRYYERLELSSVEPAMGPSQGGNDVLLRGRGFDASLRVFFGVYEAQVVSVSDTLAEVIVPAGAGQVRLNLLQGVQNYKTKSDYQYLDALEILGAEPSRAPRGGGIQMHLLGRAFDAEHVLYLDDERIEAEVIAGNLMVFQAPMRPVGEYELCVKAAKTNESLDCMTLVYYETSDMRTSAFGGQLEGALYVTVRQVGDSKVIDGAMVSVTSHPGEALTGLSDAEGRVNFHSPHLVGSQTVVACAPSYGCNSLQAVDARHITLLLEPWPKAGPGDDEDPPPPPPPPDPDAINPIEVSRPFTPTPAYVFGTASGFGKLSLESDPNKQRAAMVIASQLGPNKGYYDSDDIRTVFVEGGEFKIRARRGDLALALLCGLYDKETAAFDPRFIGVKRHLFITDGAQIKIDLDCPLPLNRTQSIKLIDAPLMSGPNMVKAHAYIYIGDEGYLGGFMEGKSDNDHVVVDKIPPFRGPFAEASLSLSAGAYTNNGSPSTVAHHHNVALATETFEAGPPAALPVFITTKEENVLKTGKIAWRIEHPEHVDFYALSIRFHSQGLSRLMWQIYLPATATTAEIPILDYGLDDEVGQIYVQLTAYKSLVNAYDFNHFSTIDLRHDHIASSAWASLAIALPLQSQEP